DPAVEQAKALLAAVGHQPPADAAAADSDRLDYLTESEGRELQQGKAPSKRLRKPDGTRRLTA
ncbi:MAG: hypothetical protein IT463_05225, partial [Planctomycetes bacterium]|nr:hypothetical protein [Planctomycetota bacterium]